MSSVRMGNRDFYIRQGIGAIGKAIGGRGRADMTQRDGLLVTGIILILLGLLSASGSVSLGTFHIQTTTGSSSGSYLVYNPVLQFLAVVFAGVGAFFLYRAGQSKSQNASQHPTVSKPTQPSTKQNPLVIALLRLTSKIDNMTYQIDRLFGSKTRVALLSKLLMNADTSFYIRQLAKETKTPYSMLYKEEKNLASLGIVNEEKKGKITLVSVNKKLPYLAELKGLMLKTAGIASFIGDALSKLQGVRYALIYGSFASGEETESSDVDILVVGDVEEESMLKAVNAIEQKTGREINYIVWNDGEFRKRAKSGHHLLTEIARKPVIMLVGEESEFRRAAKK